MTLREYQILKRYKRGNDIKDEHEQHLKQWSKIGIISYGYSFRRGTATAKLTSKGKRRLGIEATEHNPIRKIFNIWYNNLVR